MGLTEEVDRLLAKVETATKSRDRGGKDPAVATEKLGLYRPRGSQIWHWTGRVRGVKIRVSLRTHCALTAQKVARLYRSCLTILNSDFLGSIDHAQIHKGRPVERVSLRLVEVLDLYLENARSNGRRETTLKGYRGEIGQLKRGFGEDLPAKALTGTMGRSRVYRYTQARKEAGVGGRTIRSELRTLSAAWKHAQAVGMIPAKATDPVKAAAGALPAASPTADTPIFKGREELDEFRKACTDQGVLEFLLVTRFTGLRSTEVERVRWEDVDLQAGTLTWENRKAGGAAGIAKVQIRALTRKAIAFFRSLEGRSAEGRPGHPFITVQHYRQGWKLWTAAHPEHKDTRYQPRSLRHRLNSLLIEAGLPTKQVQAFLGHASPAMTHIRYAETVKDAQELGGISIDSL